MKSREGSVVTKKSLSLTAISVFVAIVLVAYGEMIAHLPAAAYDFHIFYAAAGVLQHGGNPYDIHQLFRQEQHLYPALMRDPAQRQWIQQNPYVQSPLLLIALLPFLHCPVGAAYLIWIALLVGATALSLRLLAQMWPVGQALKRSFWLLISPVAFLGPLLGQADAVLLLSLVLALWWMSRDRYALAGAVLTMGLIKPQIIAGPLILLAVMSLRHKKMRPYLGGLLAGALGTIGVTALCARPALLVTWLSSMVRFSHQTVYVQSDMSSLTALYIRWLPHTPDTGLSLAVMALWLGLCAWLWLRAPGEVDERWLLAVGLAGWMLATPYAHPHDDVLLLPAFWFLYTRYAHTAAPPARGLMTAALISWWLFPLGYTLGFDKWVPLPIAGLGIIPVLLLAGAVALRRPPIASRQTRTFAVDDNAA